MSQGSRPTRSLRSDARKDTPADSLQRISRQALTAMAEIEYVSYSDASGYGVAAAGYVRVLVELGHRVHWQAYPNDAVWAGRVGPAHVDTETARGRAALSARGAGAGRNALAALVDATRAPVEAEVRIVHLLPRFWPMHRHGGAGVVHVGMTVWETDRLSPLWLPALAGMDEIWVPSRHNLEVVRAAGPVLPPGVLVPHVARALSPPSPERLRRLAEWLGIRPGDRVFYCVSAWDPRKRLAALLDGFTRAFSAGDAAVLVLKTSAVALYDDLDAGVGTRVVKDMAQAVIDRAAAACGRAAPRIAVIADDEMADSMIDALHALGDCYVSLSRCEGFGLGSFDAAAFGRPVIGVGYGGPLDYLGADWPGRVPHRMERAAAIPGYGWFDAAQKWPAPDDAAAFGLMRAFVDDPAPFVGHAAARAETVRVAFGAAAVGERMAAALTGWGHLPPG